MYYGNTCDRQHHVARFLTNRFLQNVVQRVGLYEHTIFVSLYTDDVWLPFTPKVLNFAPKMDSIFGILSISLEWVMHIWNLVHRLITANGSWMIINFTQRGCDEGQVTPLNLRTLQYFLNGWSYWYCFHMLFNWPSFSTLVLLVPGFPIENLWRLLEQVAQPAVYNRAEGNSKHWHWWGKSHTGP